MNRIRLLSDQVANQIAAGEVVERPASVVKELVENALDAGASRVTVEIQAGGRSLVRVTDDGSGMSRDDALLCLERHATSKIQRAEDLAAIATMGFRGEALPSIASVSRFTLTTRERDGGSPEGTQIVVVGGKIMEVKAAGSATGTSVEVRQIFFNLPARRKFLRSEETESAHIQHYLTLAALAYPEVAFTFSKDARLIWQWPAVNAGKDAASRINGLRERMRAIHGSEQKLLPVDFSVELAEPVEVDENDLAVSMLREQPKNTFRVWGLMGAPGVSRSTREDQNLFVNRRPVENRGLNFALIEGYHTALMKGRFPVCCLFLEINPAAVDVNIHPSKREVKFHQEMQVRRLVTQAVRQTLLKFHTTGNDGAPARGVEHSSELTRSVGVAAPAAAIAKAPEMPRTEELLQRSNLVAPASAGGVANKAPLWEARTPIEPARPVMPASSQLPIASLAVQPSATSVASQLSAGPVPLLNVPLRVVGVVGRLYVVLESDRGLVLLDQHAAHERILFEQMLNRLEGQGSAASQKLLLPETVELSVRDAQFLRGQLAELTRLGVGLSEFGERTFLLDALPPFVRASDPRRFVLELVDELKSAGEEVNSLRLGEHTIAKTVCRHAVKANDPLGGPELENLVNDLRHCAMPYTCPHGRPTLIEMNYRELEKKFGRSQ
ncbi:DNA mismatch repair endonuclease MutL [Pedosphaera parvula]|uniref:DNA mismatch repair protein MutL n=1 Tax=Pedosphaera parvula (strain Ellin514) TaxID=320771 RepID=B9XKB3_PEDPL|nr:DNA mismatch repair endonuclease MutL [Pedosphaera parvula]EEF59751.1 DNA mismatch repair protein MutL [Pedosphaera parvula Ellin514]